MEIRFQTESFLELWPEAQSLLAAHCAEVAPDMVTPGGVVYAMYETLEQAGALHITTARHGAVLAGYAVYLLAPDMHCHGRLTAHADAFFLAREYRRGWAGRALLHAAEEALRARGVLRLVQTVTPRRDCGPLLRRMGYTLVSQQYFKEV